MVKQIKEFLMGIDISRVDTLALYDGENNLKLCIHARRLDKDLYGIKTFRSTRTDSILTDKHCKLITAISIIGWDFNTPDDKVINPHSNNNYYAITFNIKTTGNSIIYCN